MRARPRPAGAPAGAVSPLALGPRPFAGRGSTSPGPRSAPDTSAAPITPVTSAAAGQSTRPSLAATLGECASALCEPPQGFFSQGILHRQLPPHPLQLGHSCFFPVGPPIAGKGPARILLLELTPVPELAGMDLVLAGHLPQRFTGFHFADDLPLELLGKLPSL